MNNHNSQYIALSVVKNVAIFLMIEELLRYVDKYDVKGIIFWTGLDSGL